VDITERKRVERALREADRRKDEFLATLSHELRNPVAALTTVSHLLRGGMPEGADGAKIQDIMERQTRQLRRLVDDLLDLSRVRMGKLSLKREPLDLAQLVAGVIDTWRRSGLLAGRASVVADLAPAAVAADRARMEQVFSNLLHNAVKFTPATGHIRVKVGELEGEALLSVADSGCGIRPEAIEAIFEPFAQADRTLHMSEGGMGLGLPLVKRLVEAHGGAVRVESGGDGQGSTFTVRMPAASSASDQPAQSEGAVWA
jgi:signal transduction histidine kinase